MFTGSTLHILLGLLFGSIGVGYIIFGKNQRRAIAFICGVGLCVTPLVLKNAFLMATISIGIMVVPFYWKD